MWGRGILWAHMLLLVYVPAYEVRSHGHLSFPRSCRDPPVVFLEALVPICIWRLLLTFTSSNLYSGTLFFFFNIAVIAFLSVNKSVCKLWPWPAACLYKVLLECSNILSVAAYVLRSQCQVAVTENIRPVSLEYLLSGQEKVC